MMKSKVLDFLLWCGCYVVYCIDYGFLCWDLLCMGMYGVGVLVVFFLFLYCMLVVIVVDGFVFGLMGDKIFVVVELLGGNDGFNMFVFYGNDDYYC